jgi:hypothetical protein
MAKVCGAIEEDATTRTPLARGDDEIPMIPLAPRRGIAKADDLHASGRSGDDWLRQLAPTQQSIVFSNRHAHGFAQIG